MGAVSHAHWMRSSGRCGHQYVDCGSPDVSLLRLMAPYLLTLEEVKEKCGVPGSNTFDIPCEQCTPHSILHYITSTITIPHSSYSSSPSPPPVYILLAASLLLIIALMLIIIVLVVLLVCSKRRSSKYHQLNIQDDIAS